MKSRPAPAIDLDSKVHFLRIPAAYRDVAEPVTALQTHMSWVFLAGDRAYKLKKPVRFPYLDFSTLQRREAACRAELQLNRRLAPDVYLGVVPLTVGSGGLALGGTDAVVDWLVVMRRLDPAMALQTRLQKVVEPGELDQLAHALIRFYRRTKAVPVTPAAYLARWRRTLDLDRRVLLDPRLPAPRGLVRRIDAVLRHFLRARSTELCERARRRRILDGHGDLRPEHIWLGDRVRIIDCLEFDPALRAADPLAEIAFLDLECERLGNAAAGAWLRDRVLAGLGELRRDPLYRFYRCQRAMLRARLSIAHLLDVDGRTPERWPVLARTYLDIAARDAVAMERRISRPSGR